MQRFRIIAIFILITLFASILFLLINNPLFLIDMGNAIQTTQLELMLTSFLVVVLLWTGLELNNKITNKNKKEYNPFLNLPGSGLLIAKQNETSDYSFLQGISTEMIGAVISTILLGMMVLIFQQYQDIQERKKQLFIQLHSPSNLFAIQAIEEMRIEGWLADGTFTDRELFDLQLNDVNLEGSFLEGTSWGNSNLQSANLIDTKFREARLFGTDLRKANLLHADFQNTFLVGTDFQNSNLEQANFEGAILGCDGWYGTEFYACTNMANAELRIANLRGIKLMGCGRIRQIGYEDFESRIIYTGVNLRGANLTLAFLEGVNIECFLFDETTILPNGKYWSPDIDLKMFTNPDHPEYFKPRPETLGIGPWWYVPDWAENFKDDVNSN